MTDEFYNGTRLDQGYIGIAAILKHNSDLVLFIDDHRITTAVAFLKYTVCFESHCSRTNRNACISILDEGNVSYRFVNRFFGRAQILSSAYMAFSHGGNDGQKTMGVIALALAAYGAVPSGSGFYIPDWVKIICAVSIGLGTATGGWRIIRTMGMRITALRPVNGFAAETSAATVIEIATRFGIPISTTHAISGAILGVGATRRLSAVRWGIAGRIVARRNPG